MRSPVASFKRSPIKVGYLLKQSSGSWKRKRWNQRWFVLDTDTGILKYFRHESLPEAVPFRQDAHAVISLKEPGGSLVIQGDLPHGVPTPFCFTVFDGSRSFLICADTTHEFLEWTSAIASILSPRKTSAAAEPASTKQSPPSPVKPLEQDMESAGLAEGSSTTSSAQSETGTSVLSIDTSVPSPIKPLTKRRRSEETEDGYLDAPRPTLRQTLVALAMINPFLAIVRYGSDAWVYAAFLVLNSFLVFVLWLQSAPPHPSITSDATYTEDESDVSEDSSLDLVGSGTGFLPSVAAASPKRPSSPTASKAESPRKASLPRIEKVPSQSFQQTKFRGLVNGAKVKAGDSVKMCPPAPAAIITGCWTQISGTRFQVRQGPNYRKTKLKAPSDESLLDLVAIDIYRSPAKIDNIASIIDLGELKPKHSVLDLFVVNCQVPSYQPSNPLWGEKQGNGDGFNFVCYFAIPPEIREQMNENGPSNQAVRLLKTFMQDNSLLRDRFKAIGIVVNPQEQKLGRTERHLLETYNGQPILTRPQHRFYKGEGYFEVDVDAHEFNFVARKGLVGVSEHFRNMVVDFGYVIEGQEDQELPEQILGAVRLCKIDVRLAQELS